MGSVGHFTQVGKNMINCKKLFSQMAWAKTTKIGCGVQSMTRLLTVICILLVTLHKQEKIMANCEKLFSQMAWAKTTKIGCGVQWCPSNPMTIVVCNYKAA